MKTQLLKNQLVVWGGVSHLNLPLSLFFLFLSMFWFQNSYCTPVTISSDATWDNLSGPTTPPANYTDGVIITNNATLTINNITLTFGSGKAIIVEVGSHLDLINATLTSGATWLGITATGLGQGSVWVYKEQFNTFPTEDIGDETTWAGELHPDQTWVTINGGGIYYAKIAAESIDGAVIRARDCDFIDCERGLKIGPWYSYTQPKLNACFAMQCIFQWTQIMPGFSSSSFIGIDLEKVQGINIGGCVFENVHTSSYCHFDRGIGVNSVEANFAVSQAGDELCDDGFGCLYNCMDQSPTGSGDDCTFNQLAYGIKAVGNPTSNNLRTGIVHCIFTNNLYSIYIASSKHSIVNLCEFYSIRTGSGGTIGMNDLYTTHTGGNGCDYEPSNTVLKYIETYNSKEVRIKENEFTADDINVTYITIDNSGNSATSISLIKKNDFGNTKSGGVSGSDGVHAIHCKNDNLGLKIQCNDFSDMSRDIFNASGGTLRDQQEGAAQYNNNNYSTNSGSVNIYNDGNDFTVAGPGYFGPPPLLSTGGTGNVTLTDISTPVSCSDNGCEDLTEEELGIKGIKYQTLLFYPNPAQNELYFYNNEIISSKAIVTIYNSIGQVIKTTLLDASGVIDLANIPSGLIYVRISDGNIFYQQAVIKQN